MTQLKGSRILGFAFIFQFITSFSSGVFIKPLWYVGNDMHLTLIKISKNTNVFRFSILLDLLTALGIIFLGAVLYNTVKTTNENISLTAFGFYILEAGLLAVSKLEAYNLLQISREYISSGYSKALLLTSDITYQSMEFLGGTLHMIVFSIGATMFYYLLLKSAILPKWLSLWGIISLTPLLIGSVALLFNYSLPFVLYVPYVPFELFIGLYILKNKIYVVN